MKPLSERPAESRKPLTRFYGITASESELLPLKTDRSTRTPRTTSNGGLSLPCSNSALMNSHTPKLNNRRIERHTKTRNQEKVSCFFAPIFDILKIASIIPCKREIDKILQITVNFALRGVVGIRGRNFSAALAESPPRPSRVSENSMRNFRRNAINQPRKAG